VYWKGWLFLPFPGWAYIKKSLDDPSPEAMGYAHHHMIIASLGLKKVIIIVIHERFYDDIHSSYIVIHDMTMKEINIDDNAS